MHVWGGYTTIIMIKYLLYFSKDCTFWLHVREGALLEKTHRVIYIVIISSINK